MKEIKDKYKNAVLCYVKDNFAYFTTQKLKEQCGDGWYKIPYECNAGVPCSPEKEGEKWEIIKIAWEGDFETPADIACGNSKYSVEMINSGAIAWLFLDYIDAPNISISAGTTLEQFIKLIKKGGGEVFLPIDLLISNLKSLLLFN